MSHPTRQALLDAGLELTATASLSRITVDAIVHRAGVAKGTFYVHFADRAAFLVALHAQFHERLRNAVLQATAGLPPGAWRLRKGTQTYLDGCLHERAVKALLLEARCEAPITAEVQRRNAEFAALAEPDFMALGWPDPATSARLFVTLGAEAALIELETGYNEAVRQALWRFAHIEESNGTHGMRNEILASKQRNKKYVHSTYRRDDGKREQKREKRKESSIWCGKKYDPSET